MKTLRQKMKDDMILMGFAQSTQRAYFRSIIELRNYYATSPALLSADELRSYLLSLKKRISRQVAITFLSAHSDFSTVSF